MIHTESPEKPVTSLEEEDRRALIRRIVRSSTFAKSQRLSTFLSFVCDLSIKGRADEINEQKIGTAIFGRSPAYDSSADGIVRTQASRLRHRLDLYFDGEGAAEPIRILIPRGSYVPQFEPRTPIREDLPQPESEEHDADLYTLSPIGAAPRLKQTKFPRTAPHRTRWYANAGVPWALVALLVFASLSIIIRDASLSQNAHPQAAAHPFWSKVFANNQRTLIVSGDSGLVMWQGLMVRSVGLMEYLDGSYRKPAANAKTSTERIALDVGNRRYTSIVDLEIAQSLVRLALSQKSDAEAHYARDVRPNDLKQGNVILVGTAEANPWVELFESKMNFSFYNDRNKGVFSVINRAPEGTEPKHWDSEYNDPNHQVYAVVAYVPNLQGQGNALILEGTSMAGTESAWDFVADDAQLLPFLRRIQKPDASIPHFEVLLGTKNMSGSAGRNAILAWRVM